MFNPATHVTHLFAGLAVSDFSVACDWYERLFGAAPDARPKEDEAIWHPAPHASIYITADPDRAGNGLLTLAIKDIEQERLGLARRGLTVDDGLEANGLRTLVVRDADGNRIKFFEYDPANS